MTPFFNKLPILGFALFASIGSIHAQHDQFVEIQFTPNGSSEKEVISYAEDEAESFDLTAYINDNLAKGDFRIKGIANKDLSYTRINFDSKKVDDKNATLCETVSSETKPFIGIGSTGMNDFSGVLLEKIVDNSAAAAAQFQTGDVISYINDREIRSVCDLLGTVKDLEIGQEITVTYDDGLAENQKNLIVGSREVSNITWKTCPTNITQVEIPVSQTNVNAAPDYNLFPNPSTGVSTLTFEHDSRGSLSIEIFDMQGKRVLKQDNIDFDRYYEEEINISNQASGMYIVELHLNGETFTQELIVQQQ